MKPKQLMKIAWKNLWAHRLRTSLTIVGVTIGIGSIIFLLSLGFGLEKVVTEQVASFTAFATIDIPAANLKTGKINEAAIDRIRTVPHITRIERVADLAGRVRLSNAASTTETIVAAVDPGYFDLAEVRAMSGQLFTGDETNVVVVGAGLAGLLGFSDEPSRLLGRELILDLIVGADLRAGDGSDNPIVKEQLPLQVIGVTGDDQTPVMYIPLKLAGGQGVVNMTTLKVKLDDRRSVDKTRKVIETFGFSTEYVGDTVNQIAQVFAVFRVVLAGFGLIALIVASLATFNMLTIALLERLREVGLLKALGMRNKDVLRLFLAESITIGAVGGGLGIVTGLVVGQLVNLGLRLLADRAEVDAVQVFVTPGQIVVAIAVFSLIVGFVTGILPAKRAARTSALDALRYE